jgi:hyperosmotically inducible protein
MACLSTAVSVATFTTGCAGDRYSRSTGETIDDASITTKVKSEFVGDPDVKALDVKVKTYRGQVQLTGFVDSELQKQRAEEIARNTKGVQWVKNDIIVKTQEPAGAKRPYQNENLK